jgi:hypothetical protein
MEEEEEEIEIKISWCWCYAKFGGHAKFNSLFFF